MSQAAIRMQKFGGGTFIIAGILLLAANLFLVVVPPPPTTQAGFVQWLTANKFPMFMANEVLFFATILLVPSFIALGKLLEMGSKVSTFAGMSIVALALPLLTMLIVAQ